MSVRDRFVLRERESRKRGSIDGLFRGKRDVFQSSSTKKVNVNQTNNALQEPNVRTKQEKETRNVTICNLTRNGNRSNGRALFARRRPRLSSVVCRADNDEPRIVFASPAPPQTQTGSTKQKIHLIHFIFILPNATVDQA